MSDYQYNDLEVIIPVVDGKGNPIDAADYLSGTFVIATAAGMALFTATLDDGIKVEDGSFSIDVPASATNYNGQVTLEMVAYNQEGKRKTLHQSTRTFKKSIVN